MHAFTDGRDTLPHAGARLPRASSTRTAGARVGSVVGRYWAMDRDRRWDRTQRAYDLLVHGRGAAPRRQRRARPSRDAYERGETDEFIEPTLVGGEARIRPGDSVLVLQLPPRPHAPDHPRARRAGLRRGRRGAAGLGGRGGSPPVARYATLTEYEEDWPYPVAVRARAPGDHAAGVLAAPAAAQLHVAETEKYPHVTYFFNGGEEAPRAGRAARAGALAARRAHLRPQAADERARGGRRVRAALARRTRPRFGIINFANADMVGHTGVIAAAVTAVETVDECLGEVVAAVHERGGVCVVTADHGNADHMLEPDGSPNTAHSLNPVPLIVTSDARRAARRARGSSPTSRRRCSSCSDRAAAAMTGRSLIERARFAAAPTAHALLEEARRRGARLRRARAGCSAPSSSARASTTSRMPRPYEAIVPPRLQARKRSAWSCVSGVAEIIGGAGVLAAADAPARRASG